MLIIKGEVGGEYFNITCKECNKNVRLHDARWVGGVPQIKATCPECEETGDFKFHAMTLMEIVPMEKT